MKKKLLFAGLPALMLASCSSLLIPPPLENGWYEFKSVEKMTVKNKPIALASGFRDLAIDSIPMPGMKVYAIKGMVGDPETWRKATEKAVGKKIGFIYDGRLVCAPQVNAPMESGNFMITFPPSATKADVEEVYRLLLEKMDGKK